jgi:acylphosphatase
VLAVRDSDRPQAVRQPVVVLLPALPAHPSQPALVSDSAPSAEAAVRLTAWLHGRVQGVGMRWFIRVRALELGLAGWARNLPDGRVEIVAEGPESACRALLSQLGEPPAPGRVQTVVERWSQPQGVGPGFVER